MSYIEGVEMDEGWENLKILKIEKWLIKEAENYLNSTIKIFQLSFHFRRVSTWHHDAVKKSLKKIGFRMCFIFD